MRTTPKNLISSLPTLYPNLKSGIPQILQTIIIPYSITIQICAKNPYSFQKLVEKSLFFPPSYGMWKNIQPLDK